jgi:hypothetical protein
MPNVNHEIGLDAAYDSSAGWGDPKHNLSFPDLFHGR